MDTLPLRQRLSGEQGISTAGAHAGWFVAGALFAFILPFVFSSLLDLHHDVYYAIYFAGVLAFVGLYVFEARIDLPAFVRQGLMLSLAIGAVVAFWTVIDIVVREDSTPRPDGAYLAFEIGWRGLVYGAVDAILLTAFPALVAYAMLRGRVGRWAGRAKFAALTLVFTIVITATYHLGYEQYREDGIGSPEFGNVVMSVPTLISANPAGTVMAHSAMHIAAVIEQYEGDRIPPQTDAS